MHQKHISFKLLFLPTSLVLILMINNLVANNYTIQNYFDEVQSKCYNKQQQAFDFSCEKLLLFRSIVELTEQNYKWNLLGDNDTLIAIEKNQNSYQTPVTNLRNLSEIEKINEFVQSQWNKFLNNYQIRLASAAAESAQSSPLSVQEQARDNEIFQFKRNQSYADRFCHIFQDRESLLIGARNAIFNLSLSNLEERSHLFWSAEKEDSSTCYVKGINEKKCHNYIRIIEHLGLNKLFVCGTNAYKPKCRIFDTDNFTIEDEFSGVAVNPFDPDQNSTVIYIGIKDANEIKKLTLKTEPSDSINLNSPNFVSSMAQGDFIYFFLREIAVENINCGKTMFSRVARVCRNDQGGMHRFQNYWTSFLKARLNCSVPGDFPFYFDEIVSTSDFVNGIYSGEALQMVYGVFTTPTNSISGSAICAYSLKSISDAFDGNFKEQSTMNSNWLAVPTNNVPDPRPGLCHNDSRTLPDLTLNFIRTHTLMDSSVLPFYGQPILTNIGYRFTKIVVDQQVKVPGNKTFDILFIGTDNGKVLKVVNGLAASSVDKVLPIIVEEIQVFPDSSPVGNLHLVKNSIYSESRLIVTNDTHILSIKLHRCNRTKISSCSECVALQDPYCAWDKLKGECTQSNQWEDSNRYYQDITTGKHFACPKSKSMLKENVNPLREYEHNLPKNHRDESMFSSRIHTNDPNTPQQKDFVIREEPTIASTDGLPKKFSLETLLSSVILGATVSSVIGFIVGYFYGRKCHKESTDNLPYPDTDYEYFEQRQNMNCFANDTKVIPQEEVTYAEPILVPQPLRSPKNSIRKLAQPLNKHAEALYQFQNENNYSTAARDSFRNESFRRQNNLMGNVSAIAPDGYSTTRSIKKVYL